MAGVKTKRTEASVDTFIADVENDAKRTDSKEVIEMMQAATGEPPKMWGSSIVGFGSYHYKYESGREGDWMLCGFSPRKQSLVLYIMPGFQSYDKFMEKLGKHTTGKSCLYIKKLDDVDRSVLKKLIEASVAEMRSRYKT